MQAELNLVDWAIKLLNKFYSYAISLSFSSHIALLALLDSPSTMFQGSVVLEDELLEAEVGLEGEVVLQVGGGDHIPIQYEGLAGHELHEPFAEVPHQPLL